MNILTFATTLICLAALFAVYALTENTLVTLAAALIFIVMAI